MASNFSIFWVWNQEINDMTHGTPQEHSTFVRLPQGNKGPKGAWPRSHLTQKVSINTVVPSSTSNPKNWICDWIAVDTGKRSTCIVGRVYAEMVIGWEEFGKSANIWANEYWRWHVGSYHRLHKCPRDQSDLREMDDGSRMLRDGSPEPIDNLVKFKKVQGWNRGVTCGFILLIACRLAAVRLTDSWTVSKEWNQVSDRVEIETMLASMIVRAPGHVNWVGFHLVLFFVLPTWLVSSLRIGLDASNII